MSQLLAKQPYVKIVRTVDSITQTNTEEERTMYLYEDRLVTRHREFDFHTINDMSYRLIGPKGGLLYVHTNKGVFSYMVKSSPEQFVQTFKEYKQ
ncbi:hypothetical protein M3210_10530 [Oceanobacillus luteolus]|uniref:Bacterial Pleckstrin homology domain-containing protein n=1 Tax=Oceanobacillus luteolus TaxID=1274358 RepID=A0ABW4HKX0_9BACI|nr:hypothetical protein [Oceanobacillus luteolus]MCM3740708.1 hypothetical protein [Oceanobacillus luteolus]